MTKLREGTRWRRHSPHPGISCQGCANTIEKALGTIPDVSRVSVDVAKKTVTVSHGERVERETLEDALAGAGYPAAGMDTPTITIHHGAERRRP